MQKKKKNTFIWFEFEILSQFTEIVHAVFWNFPLGERDDVSHPKKALDVLGIEKGVKLKQCHRDDLLEVKGADQIDHYDDYDGIVTQRVGIGLLIRHADCQGTIFYDPVQKAIGNVHCGWRGSTLNIYKKTVEKMERLYGSRPKDLIVCIGPSLGPHNAEFKHYKEELPKSFWKYQVCPLYFDFWEISRAQLLDAGVLKEHIEIAKICTYDEGFSYRKNKLTPHHGTIVALSN